MTEQADEEFREFMAGRWLAMVRLALHGAGHVGAGVDGGPAQRGVRAGGASVAHLVVTLADGSTIRVPAIRVPAIRAGGQKFFAFALAPGQRAVRWPAYDAARQVVAPGGRVGGS
jgi:hypothetical protein